jgi:hypothetical protein
MALVYTDIYTHSNVMDHSDCESGEIPHLRRDGFLLSNCSVVQSNEQKSSGSYSFKVTKTNAAGTAAVLHFNNSISTGNMHGLYPSTGYRMSVAAYVPSSGGPTASEVSIRMRYHNGTSWTSETDSASTTDSFENLTKTVTTATNATGIDFGIVMASTMAQNEYFYIDTVTVGQAVKEASDGRRGPSTGKKWYRCHTCALNYSEDEIGFVGGAPYCKKLGCYADQVEDRRKKLRARKITERGR